VLVWLPRGAWLTCGFRDYLLAAIFQLMATSAARRLGFAMRRSSLSARYLWANAAPTRLLI
jgi:hypothetical protein